MSVSASRIYVIIRTFIDYVYFKGRLLVRISLRMQAPTYITNLLVPYKPERVLRSGEKSLQKQPRSRLVRLGDRAFFCNATSTLLNVKRTLNPSKLRLLLSKAQGHKDFWKPSKNCHVGINWKALAEYSQMSTQVPGFYSIFNFLHHFHWPN